MQIKINPGDLYKMVDGYYADLIWID
jgi:hypothetical protein